MTPRLSAIEERISPEDIALASWIHEKLVLSGWRTYEFHITSDTLTDSEVTHS